MALLAAILRKMGRRETGIIILCWTISGVVSLIAFPVVFIISIFRPAVMEKAFLPTLVTGGALVFAPFVLIALLLCGYGMLILVWLGVFALWKLLFRCCVLLIIVIDLCVFWTPPLIFSWRQGWTIQTPRYGWQSSHIPQQSDSRHSGDNSKSEYRTSSNLCRECSRIVHQSGLLVGSIFILTPGLEWHNWPVSLRGIDLKFPQNFCHLCNILWSSIPEPTRRAIADESNPGTYGTFQNQVDKPVTLRLKIWDDGIDRWYPVNRRFMQVHQGEKPLCHVFEISKGNSCGC